MMKKGNIKYFKKSGNKVELVKPVDEAEDAWIVKRIDGESKGKEMICLKRTLVNSLD